VEHELIRSCGVLRHLLCFASINTEEWNTYFQNYTLNFISKIFFCEEFVLPCNTNRYSYASQEVHLSLSHNLCLTFINIFLQVGLLGLGYSFFV